MPHTPGPWEVFEGGNFIRIVAAGYHERRKATRSGYLGGPLSVAEANYAPTDDYESDHAKALANGRLIAAAPELLCWANRLMAELREAKDANPEAFAEFVNEVCSAGFPDACIAMAKTIAKAEGRS